MPSEIVSPRWREEVVLWAGRAPGFRAWRQHDALQSKFHPEHADDIPVFFRDAASGRDEQMWVHVIGYDRPSDEYLGILINTPDLVSSIQAGDNVAFKNVDWAEYPWALSVGGSYRQAGLPAFAPSGLLEITAQALNQYRQGNFGHNRPAIEAAITSFQRAQTMVTEETYPANRFCLHFYLARCYSEIYATTEAAEEFGRALAIFICVMSVVSPLLRGAPWPIVVPGVVAMITALLVVTQPWRRLGKSGKLGGRSRGKRAAHLRVIRPDDELLN